METTSTTVPAGPPWDEAKSIATTLRDAGHEAWFVGGCVRDLLLGRAVKDVDVATDATPERVESLFPKTLAVGKSFGVMIVVAPSGANVEVATFRHDGRYLDGRRPEQVTFGTAVEDVARRDFTVNALLLQPLSGEVADHVGGLADLRERRLRAVGDASARLHEDRLRVLRALRFAAQLDLAIEPATWTAVRATELSGLSSERIVQEWFKGLDGARRGAWLRLLADSGRLAEFCAPLAGITIEATAAALDRLDAGSSRAARAAAWLAAAAAGETATWLERMPLEKAFVRQLSWLLERLRALPEIPALGVAARRRLALDPLAGDLLAAARATAPEGPGTIALAAAIAVEAAGPRHAPLLRAGDLLGLGLKPGPRVGDLIKRLEDAQLEGRFGTREDGLELARRWLADPP
jgi:tRNA nucleotidyltransferase/poly(A) polymerase